MAHILLDVHPTAVVLLQSLLFLLQPLKQAPVGLPAPSSRGRLCCRAGLAAPSFSHRWPCHPSTHPHLLLFSGDSRRTSKPSYSSPRGLPLLRLPRLRVVPFLGLAVVTTTALVLSARRGQHGQRPTSIGSVLYMERLTAGSMRPQGSASLLRTK